MREAVLTENDELEGNNSTPDNATFENDSGDQVFSFAATSVLGNRATNEFKVGHVRENLLQGPRLFFDDGWNFIGLDGREQFDLGLDELASRLQRREPEQLPGGSHSLARDR